MTHEMPGWRQSVPQDDCEALHSQGSRQTVQFDNLLTVNSVLNL